MRSSYKPRILLSTVFLLGSLVGSCASGEKKDAPVSTPETSRQASKLAEKFFSQTNLEEEAIRVFVTSDDYELKQTGFTDNITVITDTSGRNSMGDEIKPYDMVDLFTEGVYKIELFKESGQISKIRPIKPAHISEINKLIADDITRLKFKFVDSEKPEPLTFKIRYGVQLRKKKSQDEIRKVLQENVRE